MPIRILLSIGHRLKNLSPEEKKWLVIAVIIVALYFGALNKVK